MKVFVTGGAGYIGSNLVDALLARGDQVCVLDNLTTGLINNIQHNLSNPNFKLINGSILDKHLVDKLVEDSDLVFHLAAAVGVKYIVDNPLDSIITNVAGTENVLSKAFKYWKKVIIASTSEIYGKNNNVPFKEDDDRVLGSTQINRWSYSAAKAIDEHFAFSFFEKGLPVTTLRFFNSYGPRINELAYGTVVAAFIKQALQNEPITIHGDGNQTRCFTFIEDTVRGIIQSSEAKEAEGQVFNIGNDHETRVEELAYKIKELSGSQSEVIKIPYCDFYGQSYEDTYRRVPDITKAKTTFGFDPKISLDEGLSKTITWCRDNYFKGKAK